MQVMLGELQVVKGEAQVVLAPIRAVSMVEVVILVHPLTLGHSKARARILLAPRSIIPRG